ncbi:hypothetical protein FHX82_002510 [Amycolatopsis bartoniae]|nr:hypothetical protein [Amycolatopsis bartoniae]MBB2935456.1 hypothetical protein [Amycolatopsis bartoniae]TVT04470.1 hypothetical protein FNH07_23925 [Amycolatopsis bartoniae]
METLPLPPEPAPLPPAPISAHRQVLAAYDRIGEADLPELWTTLRSSEDVLVEAKAVDVRVRAGEALPLAGLLAVAPPDAIATRRLIEAGAVVLGEAASPADVVSDFVDIAIGERVPAQPGVLVFTPTAGLVPGGLSVLARTVADGQSVLSAITGPDVDDPTSRPWPESVRLSAGERPHLAVRPGAGPAFRKAVGDLLAGGATVETAVALAGHDALLAPAGSLELTTVSTCAADILVRPFDDQIALDLAAYLNDEQLRIPYPATGIDLVVFGAHLRGQPLNSRLVELGARFRGEARTASRYRMVALPGNQPGILPAAQGSVLTGERWTISPAGLEKFLAGQPPAEIELEDGDTAIGLHCTTEAAGSCRDITEFGDWRAYLRYLTAIRPMSG